MRYSCVDTSFVKWFSIKRDLGGERTADNSGGFRLDGP